MARAGSAMTIRRTLSFSLAVVVPQLRMLRAAL